MRIFSAIVLIGSVALGAISKGSLFCVDLTHIGLELSLAAASILLLFAAVQWLRGRLNTSGLGKAAWVWSVLACGLFLFGITGRFTNQYEIAAVHAYVAKAIPVLEKIRDAKGSYPKTLPVSQLGNPPILLRTKTGFGYNSDGKEFGFYYSNPADMFGEGDRFNSSTREWSHDDPLD
jgi:hypothetical protein